ncbi:hypothetical protein [Calothrix rhizosoleniae]|nr:hypothetical protein [Calothrix rhizosoleniae]
MPKSESQPAIGNSLPISKYTQSLQGGQYHRGEAATQFVNTSK